MSKINKQNESTVVEYLKEAGSHVALGLMVGATVVGMAVEVAEHHELAVLAQHANYANAQLSHGPENAIRREKEEVRHLEASYGVLMRSEATAGSV